MIEVEKFLQLQIDNLLKTDGEKYWWNYSLLERALTDLTEEITKQREIFPFVITTNSGYWGNSNYLIKAKGSSVKIMEIEMDTHRDNNQNSNNHFSSGNLVVDKLIVNQVNQNIYDWTSLVGYITDRVKRLSISQDKKLEPFNKELASAGITEKEFYTLKSIYDRLDAPSRRLIDLRGRN